MTWSSTLRTGRGTISWRLEIERTQTQWVTHASMANQVRKVGLRVSGGKVKTISQPASGTLDVTGMSVSIVDIGGAATAEFAQRPTKKTYLTAQCDFNDFTSIDVLSTAGWPSAGNIWIDSEVISYSSASSTSFDGLLRGQLGSMAQTHYTSTGGTARFPEVTDRPVTLAGARTKLWVYGDNDDPNGSGTLFWEGLLLRDPTFDGAAWSFFLEPLTALLDRTVNADLAEPTRPRGIYYSARNPFRLGISVDGGSYTVAFPTESTDTAYFDDNAAFVPYLNAKILSTTGLSAALTAAGATVFAVADGDTSWHLEATTGAVTGTVLVIPSSQPTIDPVFNPEPTTEPGGTPITTTTLPANDRVYWMPTDASLSGAGSVPRGYFGTLASSPVSADDATIGAFPATRMYLGGIYDFSAVTNVQIEWPSLGPQWVQVDQEYELVASNATLRFIQTANSPGHWESTDELWHGFTSTTLPEVRFGRRYVLGGGNIGDMLAEICSLAPTGLNLGAVPSLRTTDFEDVFNVFPTVTDRVVNSRTYASFGDFNLMDIIKPECLLAGYAIATTPTGRIRFFEVKPPVRNALLADALTASGDRVIIGSPIVSNALPVWEPSTRGLVNTMVFRRGYDAREDAYNVGPVVINDIAAYGQSPRAYAVEVAPKSRLFGDDETIFELEVRARKFLASFAYPHAMVRVDCDPRYLTRGIGDMVYITSPHIPDVTTGTRGVTLLPAQVFGREVSTGSLVTTLYCYATMRNVAAYVPEFFISAASNIAGNQWGLDVTLDGDTVGSYYAAGYRVEVWRYDSTMAGVVLGTVDSIDGDDALTVTFDTSAAGLSTDTWVLRYAQADESGVTDAQLTHAYIAEGPGLISTASAPIAAKEYG